MGKVNGIVICLTKDRERVFRDALDEQDFFAEAVNKFNHSRSSPLICFVVNTKGMITHIARGRRGVNAGTGQSRLNLNDIVAMQTMLNVTDIIDGVPVRRQGFWDQCGPKLRERLAHLVGLIMRRAGDDASVALRVSFVWSFRVVLEWLCHGRSRHRQV